jgi:hypothetical protein
MRSLLEGVSQEEVENAFPGLGDARSRLRGYPGAGLADEKDTSSVVPITPADVERQRLTSSDGSWDTRTVAASYRHERPVASERSLNHEPVT